MPRKPMWNRCRLERAFIGWKQHMSRARKRRLDYNLWDMGGRAAMRVFRLFWRRVLLYVSSVACPPRSALIFSDARASAVYLLIAGHRKTWRVCSRWIRLLELLRRHWLG